MRQLVKMLAAGLTLSVAATIAGPGAAQASTNPGSSPQPVSSVPDSETGRDGQPRAIAPGLLPPDTYPSAIEVYGVVEAIPPELTGDEAAAGKWVDDEFYKRGWTGCPECRTIPMPAPRADVGKCLAGIATAIASNIIAAGKVLKLWKLVKDVGGAKRLVDLINEAFKRSGEQQRDALETLQEVFNEAGLGFGAIAAEVLSIDGIIDNCF